MSKLLTIVGPTATGKTAFAWQIAAFFWQHYQQPCDLISADSRQVYQGLEVVSGLDLPQQSHPEGDCFRVDQHRLWGVTMLKPTEEWSVAHFNQLVERVTTESWREHRLPIIVGGTGLYSELSMTTDPQLVIPPDVELRDRAEGLSLVELQVWVQREASSRWAAMNESDRANPRRLVRALEIARHKVVSSPVKTVKKDVSELVIGINAPIEYIEEKIAARVRERWQTGALPEITRLQMLAEDNPHLPALSSTGVKQVLAYLNDQATTEQAQAAWITSERQYAKRQITWWKKRPQVEWFAVDQANWQALAMSRIDTWYQAE